MDSSNGDCEASAQGFVIVSVLRGMPGPTPLSFAKSTQRAIQPGFSAYYWSGDAERGRFGISPSQIFH